MKSKNNRLSESIIYAIKGFIFVYFSLMIYFGIWGFLDSGLDGLLEGVGAVLKDVLSFRLAIIGAFVWTIIGLLIENGKK